MQTVDQQYLDIGNTINRVGRLAPSRAGATRMIFNATLTHDMANGFPLLRCKRVAWKPMMVEWVGFMLGITDKDWYQHHGCKIWDSWSNPTNGDDNDLGPIYGKQWRNFNGVPVLGDQIRKVLGLLKDDLYDRRAVVSAWNPLQQHEMALPPCHYSFNLVYDGRLNLVWNQRSADWPLGVPFDLAHYGLMLLWFAEQLWVEPGLLVGHFANAHIYENQRETWKDLGSAWHNSPGQAADYPEVYSEGPTSLTHLSVDTYKMAGYVHNGTFRFPLST